MQCELSGLIELVETENVTDGVEGGMRVKLKVVMVNQKI